MRERLDVSEACDDELDLRIVLLLCRLFVVWSTLDLESLHDPSLLAWVVPVLVYRVLASKACRLSIHPTTSCRFGLGNLGC